jgi:hypothetical protein
MFEHRICHVRGYPRWELFVVIATDLVTVEALSESIKLTLYEVRPEPLYELAIATNEITSGMADGATYY